MSRLVSAPARPPLPRWLLARWQLPAAILAVACFEVVVAIAFTRQPVGVAGLAIVAVGAAAFLWRPEAGLAVGVLTLALVPVYTAPKIGPLYLEATVCVLWLLAGVIALRLALGGVVPRLTLLDVAVAGFFALLAIPALLGIMDLASYVQRAFMWLGPYLGARLLLEVRPDTEHLARWMIGAAVLVVPFALLESSTGTNPFQALSLGGAGDDVWLSGQSRLGAERAEVAWGHSIALGMFFGVTGVLALAMAVREERRMTSVLWLAAAAAILAGLSVTLSRTGWLTAAAGFFLLFIGVSQVQSRRRLAGLAAAAVVGVVMASVVLPKEAPSPLRLVSGGSAEVADSSRYRQLLIESALRPDALTLFGNPEGNLARSFGGESIDNAYLEIAEDWGIVSMLGLIFVVVAVMVSLVRLRASLIDVAVAAAALAMAIGLLFVAFITQQQILFWLLVGCTGGLVAARGTRRPA